ncbi:hypothetical protein I4U23_022724 [Adineta vaga]|nr:hypothetical protein I4U23_022724 [Adineta vaga]
MSSSNQRTDSCLEPTNTPTKVNDIFNRSISPEINANTISASPSKETNSLSKYNTNEMTKKKCKNHDNDHSSSSESELGTIERIRQKQRDKKSKIRRLACPLLSCLLCLSLLAAAITTALLLTLLHKSTTSTSSTTVTSTTATSTTSITNTTPTTSTTSTTDTTSPSTSTSSTTSTQSTTTQVLDLAQQQIKLTKTENGGTGTNLLLNGNFESGSSVGWNLYSCSSACSASIISSTSCEGGSGTCYHNDCTPSSNIQFLEQYFTTTIGVTYNVTFSVLKGGSGLGSGTAMYVNAVS